VLIPPIGLDQSLITAWTQSATTFMLLMTVGYTLLEQAQIRGKNRRHIVVKNLMIVLLSLLSFFVLGYAFAFGDSTAGIVGGQSDYFGIFKSNGLYHER